MGFKSLVLAFSLIMSPVVALAQSVPNQPAEPQRQQAFARAASAELEDEGPVARVVGNKDIRKGLEGIEDGDSISFQVQDSENRFVLPLNKEMTGRDLINAINKATVGIGITAGLTSEGFLVVALNGGGNLNIELNRKTGDGAAPALAIFGNAFDTREFNDSRTSNRAAFTVSESSENVASSQLYDGLTGKVATPRSLLLNLTKIGGAPAFSGVDSQSAFVVTVNGNMQDAAVFPLKKDSTLGDLVSFVNTSSVSNHIEASYNPNTALLTLTRKSSGVRAIGVGVRDASPIRALSADIGFGRVNANASDTSGSYSIRTLVFSKNLDHETKPGPSKRNRFEQAIALHF